MNSAGDKNGVCPHKGCEGLVCFQEQRRKFEDDVSGDQEQALSWLEYAKWEESIGELRRARLVFERALKVNGDSAIWLAYGDMEMRNGSYCKARAVWDRVVSALPKVKELWLKFVSLEESAENISSASLVFARWLIFKPDEDAWYAYIDLLIRSEDYDEIPHIFDDLINIHGHNYRNWVQYADFEVRYGSFLNARSVYDQAVKYFADEQLDNKLLLEAYAQFEEKQGQFERAHQIRSGIFEAIKSGQSSSHNAVSN